MNTDKPTDASLNPEKTVADVMNTDVVTVQLNDVPPIADDMKHFFDACYFPVLDSGKLAGIVDQSDLVGWWSAASNASLSSKVKHSWGWSPRRICYGNWRIVARSNIPHRTN